MKHFKNYFLTFEPFKDGIIVDVVVAIGVSGLEFVVLVVDLSVGMAAIFNENGNNLFTSLELLWDLKLILLVKSLETPLESKSLKLLVLKNESA